MNVGNIITSLKIEEDNFNISPSLDDADINLPTLIIGWNNIKEKYKGKLSILHKKINDNLYWTFSPQERKVDFEKDIVEFKKLCFDNIGKDIHYVYIDPLHTTLKTIKKIIKKIYSFSFTISYVSSNDMLYILGDNIIFGVDLNIMEFIGIKKSKIINKINDLPESILVGNEIFNKCKDLVSKLNNKNRLVPYIVKYGKYY